MMVPPVLAKSKRSFKLRRSSCASRSESAHAVDQRRHCNNMVIGIRDNVIEIDRVVFVNESFEDDRSTSDCGIAMNFKHCDVSVLRLRSGIGSKDVPNSHSDYRSAFIAGNLYPVVRSVEFESDGVLNHTVHRFCPEMIGLRCDIDFVLFAPQPFTKRTHIEYNHSD